MQKHPPEEEVFRCLEALDLAGGTLPAVALGIQTGISSSRLEGFLAKTQRLLNVDGGEVLRVDPTQECVSLNVTLLRELFELG